MEGHVRLNFIINQIEKIEKRLTVSTHSVVGSMWIFLTYPNQPSL